MIDADLIETTLERVAEIHGDPRARIYEHLFALYPAYEDLFVMDKDGGVRGAMLQSSFDCLLGVARNDTQTPRFLLEAARINHDGFGIQEHELDRLFVAMRDVFRDILAGEWTAAMENEWSKLLTALSNIQLSH